LRASTACRFKVGLGGFAKSRPHRLLISRPASAILQLLEQLRATWAGVLAVQEPLLLVLDAQALAAGRLGTASERP
jgi:hypothetical protein